jgi:hypothetical protein
MPVVASSAYNTCEDVLNFIRVILNDSEVAGGDVLTDTAPFTFVLLNGAYRRTQAELAKYGIETLTAYWWLIGLPAITAADPEARLIIDNTGTTVMYPNGIGGAYYLTPQLPTNLVLPLKLWERQTNTTNYAVPMRQPNNGLLNLTQQAYLVDWQWESEALYMRGAQNSQDIKIMGEKALPPLVSPSDPVPIRGVPNAAAYFGAKIFAESRGGAISPAFDKNAHDEIFLLAQANARRRQRKQVRRQPYSGRDRNRQTPI